MLQAVPTLLGLSMLIFALGSRVGDPSREIASAGLLPGQDPTPQQVTFVRHQLGFDRALPIRYLHWLGRAIHGDLGRSIYLKVGVADQIRKAFPATAALAVAAMVVIVVLAIPLGVAGAFWHRGFVDSLLRILALAGASIPGFFLAYLLVFVFAVRLHLLPVVGTVGLRSLVLPAFALAIGPAALLSRLLRASLLESMSDTYTRTARGKGLGSLSVLVHHAARNAALPALTVLGSTFGRLLEGAVVMEVIFARSGLGLLTYQAVGSSDFPVVEGCVLFGGAIFMGLNLLIDVSYAIVDPRVRLGARP